MRGPRGRNGDKPIDGWLNRRDQEKEGEKEGRWLVLGEQRRSKGEEPSAGQSAAGGQEVKGWRLTSVALRPKLKQGS